MFEALLVTALLTVVDPVGDVVGDGTLEPPSAAVYRNLAPFDLREVVLTEAEDLTLIVELGSLSNPFELPLGFSLPVIEVYVSGQETGNPELLAGSGMRLPAQQGWEVAVRLTGEEAVAYRWTGEGVETAVPTLSIDGNSLIVTTPFPRPERPRLYAMTGLYDLFGSSPWRPLDGEVSPWAFSSDAQSSPVVDVLARDEAAQRQALETGILPAAGARRSTPGSLWLILMALGLLVSLVGIVMRTASRRPPEPAGAAPDGEPAPVELEGEPVAVAPGEPVAAYGRASRGVTRRGSRTGKQVVPVTPDAEPSSDAESRSRGADTPSGGGARPPIVWSNVPAGPLGTDVHPGGEGRDEGPASGVVGGTVGGMVDDSQSDSVPLVEPAIPTSNGGGVAAGGPERRDEDRGGTGPEGGTQRPFTWDSSALLTEAVDDDEFAEEFGDGISLPDSARQEAVWQRPVPLPFDWKRKDAGTRPEAPDEEEPELVRDDEDEPEDER